MWWGGSDVLRGRVLLERRLGAAQPAHGDDDSIRWLSWGEGTFLHARSVGRPLLLYLDATWCAPCRLLEREVLSDPEVVRQVQEGFVPIGQVALLVGKTT